VTAVPISITSSLLPAMPMAADPEESFSATEAPITAFPNANYQKGDKRPAPPRNCFFFDVSSFMAFAPVSEIYRQQRQDSEAATRNHSG
jgi:hypothetical protein